MSAGFFVTYPNCTQEPSIETILRILTVSELLSLSVYFPGKYYLTGKENTKNREREKRMRRNGKVSGGRARDGVAKLSRVPLTLINGRFTYKSRDWHVGVVLMQCSQPADRRGGSRRGAPSTPVCCCTSTQ